MSMLDDWPRVKQVLEGALARQGADREAYLEAACGTDATLRARVDDLLAGEDQVRTFLETPAAVLLDADVGDDLSGRSVGSYQLISRLGVGGMGEVYLAHDTKLERRVALKVLSAVLAADHDRLRRFHQEARAASSLNHPHIVVVHDFGELDGRPFIVTELIEGETLRRRLQRGPLSMREVVDIGVQISEALAAAHARGIVHRDIKPENVMLRPDGYAKVLDFGLAKLAPGAPRSLDQTWRTEPGLVVGTPRYMSPEQARGLDLDARSDVWSLGVTLYEMATGALPFASLAPSEAEKPDLPQGFLRIIDNAVQTVRDLRYPSAGELCADLKRLQSDPASIRSSTAPSVAHEAASRRRGRLALAAVLVIATGALVTAWWARSTHVSETAAIQKSVAVLPFENVGNERSLDHLRLALADEVATALSWTPSLAVRPIAGSRKFLDGGVTSQQAGRELRVGGVVTGHFSKQRSELRVTVEAVEVDGNRLLWRDTIAVPEEDAIALRDRLTSLIREGLVPALGVNAPPATPDRPRSAEAYAFFLKSLALSSDPEPNREGIALLERASAIDPDYAETWASLSRRYYADGHYGGGGGNALRRSEAAARRALTLNPDHTAAIVRLFTLQVEAGRLQDGYDSALKLVMRYPDSGEAHMAMSYVLRYGGLLEESARACEEAVARDVTNPNFRTCAQPLMLLGRYDRALDFVRLDSGSRWARAVTRLIYQRMDRRDDAREQHDQLAPEYLREVAPEMFHGLLARCLSGAPPEAQGRVTDADVRTFLNVREDPEPLYFWAGDLAYCGHTAPALLLLRESIRRNFCAAVAIETDPAFASIRNTPEYDGLLAAARSCRTRFQEHVASKARTP